MVNLCDNRRVLGVSCADYRCDGAFAEYIVVPERVLYRLPAEVSFVEAAMVEPLSVAAHAVSLGRVGPQTRAVVVGTGVIGLLLVQSLRAASCERIIAVDVNAERLSRALRLGATTSIRSDTVDALEQLWHATDGRGADVAFEAVGISPTVNLAIEGVRKGGTVVLVGNVAPEVAFPLQSVVTRQISLRGSTASAGEYATCIDWLARRRVDPGELISAVAPLAEGPRWFDRLRGSQGDLLKVILEP
jgi:threonine dehydrogenase-like Zn-dependent dehydrogenase